MVDNLPNIGLLTMAFDSQRLIVNSIDQALKQDYPHEKLTQYIIHQKDEKGNYPEHITCDREIKIIQGNVDGKWSGLWLFKLVAFLDNCKEPYMAMWDFDDYFERDYLRVAFTDLISNKNVCGWSDNQIIVKKGSIKKEPYKVSIGTLIGRVDCLRESAHEFLKMYPTGLIYAPLSHGRFASKKPYWRGPLDHQFRQYLEKKYAGHISIHKGCRWYVFAKGAATELAGHHDPEDGI